MLRNYRVLSHVISADLVDESVLLHMDTKQYYQLNETGQRVWTLLQQGAAADAIVADLVANFDVSAQTAAAGYTRLTDELVAASLIEPA